MPLQIEVSSIRKAHSRVLAAGYLLSAFIGCAGGTLIAAMALDLSRRPEGVGSLGLLALFAGLLFFVPVTLMHFIAEPLRRALRDVKGESLYVVAEEKGLRIPTLLLTDPAFSRLLKAGETTLVLPWKDIEYWEVRGARGDMGPQFFVRVSGESSAYGKPSAGSSPVWRESGFGIARAPFGEKEKELLALVRAKVATGVHVEVKSWWRKAS